MLHGCDPDAVKRLASERAISEQAAAFMARRERIATAAMQGLLANSVINADTAAPNLVADRAVAIGDALMARLDRDPEAGA